MAYPIDVRVDYGDGTRSRGLAVLGIIFFLKVVLLIPHLIALWVMGTVTAVVSWIGYWAILFTGRQPDGIDRIIAGTIRWGTRLYAWIPAATDKYPEFGLDDGPEGAQTSIDVDEGPTNRLLAASGIIGIKFLLAIPHFIVIAVLQWVASIVGWIGFVVILFTGSLPEGMHNFYVGVLRWSARASGWIGSLTDTYPPFQLD